MIDCETRQPISRGQRGTCTYGGSYLVSASHGSLRRCAGLGFPDAQAFEGDRSKAHGLEDSDVNALQHLGRPGVEQLAAADSLELRQQVIRAEPALLGAR